MEIHILLFLSGSLGLFKNQGEAEHTRERSKQRDRQGFP